MNSNNVFDLARNLHTLQKMYSKGILTFDKLVDLSLDELYSYLNANKIYETK